MIFLWASLQNTVLTISENKRSAWVPFDPHGSHLEHKSVQDYSLNDEQCDILGEESYQELLDPQSGIISN